MPTAIEKTNIIRKEFLELELNHDEYISLQTLYFYLDKKSKKQFDRELGDQLYQQMQKSFNGKITVDEFIRTFLQAEDILTKRISDSEKKLVEYQEHRKQAIQHFQVLQQKFQEVKDVERYNQFGIKEGSQLRVYIRQGSGFPNQAIQLYLQLGDHKQEAEILQGPSPQWDSQFYFKVQTGLEELQVFFITINHPNLPQLLGTATISLSALLSQELIQQKLQLYDKQGGLTNYQANLDLQWSYSQAKYYSQQIEKWDEQVKLAEDDLKDYQRDIAALYEPFPSLLQQCRGEQFQLTTNNVPKTNIDSQDLLKISRAIILVILFLCVLVCFGKAQFLDILICFYFILDYENGTLNKNTMIFYAILFGASFVLDLVWAAKYSSGFWGGFEIDKFYLIEAIPNRLSLIILYVLFVFKTILIVLLGLKSQQMENLAASFGVQSQVYKY